SLDQEELPDWLQEAELELPALDEAPEEASYEAPQEVAEEAPALPLDDPFSGFLGEEALVEDAPPAGEGEDAFLGEDADTAGADDWLADFDSGPLGEEHHDDVPAWLREMGDADMAALDL